MTPSEEGFYKRSGGSTSWIGIVTAKDKKGQERSYFAEKAAEGDDGAVSRINKKGNVVWEKHYEAMGLIIKKVYLRDDQFGKTLNIRGKTKTIQVPFGSNHASKFVACCRNINLNALVGFEPYRMVKKDANDKVIKDDKGAPKFTTGWTIKQGGTEKENKLENDLDLSRDGPVPAMRKLKNGKWDSSDREEYLEEYLMRWIKENDLDSKAPEAEEEEEEEEPVVKKKKRKVADDDDDSMPF